MLYNSKIELGNYYDPPDDGFEDWYDEVVDKKITDDFFEKHEQWLCVSNGQFNKWMNKLFKKGKTPSETAAIVERAFKLYKQH